MKPQNNYFNSYIYILYFQSKVHYYFTPNKASCLVVLIFRIQYCLTDVLEQLGGGGFSALNVMAICEQRHANVS